jgi:orotidine-5'-phosphate decarboxylase
MQHMEHFADRLIDGMRAKGSALCVGLDPRWDRLPGALRKKYGDGTLEGVARAYEEFCCRVMEVVAPLVAVVKPQSAFFEACGPPGMLVLQRTIATAKRNGLLAIMDGKRNDIAATATAYADAGLAGTCVDGVVFPIWDADAVTVNPYLGREAIEPFLQSARRSCRGVFVLVRTSNPGGAQFQDLRCEGQPLFAHVTRAVNEWARENLGRHGFGDVGAVVGATHPAELAAVREMAPDALLLLPGLGAQGATAADTAGAFRRDGLGAIVNSARDIIFSFEPADPAWESKIEARARSSVAALAEATPMAKLTASSPPSTAGL